MDEQIGTKWMKMKKESEKEKKVIYKTMKRIRMIEEAIAEKYPEGKMRCPTHLSIGQELTPTIISMLTSKRDKAVSTHRCHAHYLAKGGSLKRMIAELHGKTNGCCKGKGGSMHLIDMKVGFMGSSAIVGNSIPVGTGIALAEKIRKTNNISIVYLGDAATEEGVFYESINFAALKKLDILYVCENNLYSVYTPLKERQPPNRNIVETVKSMGVEYTKNLTERKTEDLYKELKLVLGKIKKNGGPGFVEVETYRWREHCGPNYDNHIGYRNESEFMEYQKTDPLNMLEQMLTKEVVEFEIWKEELEKRISDEISRAFEYAEQSPWPEETEGIKGIYADNGSYK